LFNQTGGCAHGKNESGLGPKGGVMKTYLTPIKDIERKWYVVNAQDKVLGRVASEIAFRLRGKHKPNFSPFMDAGDFIIVVNVEKLKLTGKKWDEKVYYRHTGYMGGLKAQTAKEMRDKKPEDLIGENEKRAPHGGGYVLIC